MTKRVLSESIDKQLEAPLLIERFIQSNETQKSYLFDFSHKEPGSIYVFRSTPVRFYINSYLCMLSNLVIVNTRTGERFKHFKEMGNRLQFDYLPKPNTFKYIMDNEYFNTSLREGDISTIIARDEDSIKIFKVKLEFNQITITVEEDIEFYELQGLEHAIIEEIESINIMTVGENIIVIKTFERIIFYSLSKKRSY